MNLLQIKQAVLALDTPLTENTVSIDDDAPEAVD